MPVGAGAREPELILMPVLLFTALLAVAAVTDDRGPAATARPQPRAVAGKPAATPAAIPSSTPALDAKSPPKWWLEQMQRPCVITGKRVSC